MRFGESDGWGEGEFLVGPAGFSRRRAGNPEGLGTILEPVRILSGAAEISGS